MQTTTKKILNAQLFGVHLSAWLLMLTGFVLSAIQKMVDASVLTSVLISMVVLCVAWFIAALVVGWKNK